MPSESTLHVRNLAALQRAFRLAGREASGELRELLANVAEPVRATAQRLAGSEIRNLHRSEPWTVMRVGITQSLVYVAPKERGRRSRQRPQASRPNLAGLLMDRAMAPALEQNEARIEHAFDFLLQHVGETWERAA